MNVIVRTQSRQLIHKLRHVKRIISTPFYLGNNYYCPVCNGQFKKMKPFKGFFSIKGKMVDHYTPNSVCPQCNSLMRHRFILQFLMDKSSLLSGNVKLLHFAPETHLRRYFKRQKNIEYIGCDINPSNYPGAIKIDITQIDLPDASIDVIVANHVLAYIKNDIQAIKELYRILRPGGWALISVPIYGQQTYEESYETDFNEREKIYGIGHQMRLLGLDFKNKLEDAGFKATIFSVEDIQGNYFERTAVSPHIDSDKYLFYCKKEL